MAEHHDEHGPGGHGGHHGSQGLGAWLDQHLGGAITPFGKQMETLFERTLVLSVNGFFMKAATACVAIMTPVLLLEFVMRTVRF